MKKWTKIVGAVLPILLLIGTAAWWSWPNREPVYKGKGLREYVYDFAASEHVTWETAEALRFFGTNTVPHIRAGL